MRPNTSCAKRVVPPLASTIVSRPAVRVVRPAFGGAIRQDRADEPAALVADVAGGVPLGVGLAERVAVLILVSADIAGTVDDHVERAVRPPRVGRRATLGIDEALDVAANVVGRRARVAVGVGNGMSQSLQHRRPGSACGRARSVSCVTLSFSS